MTLEEAIKHAEEVAEKLENSCKRDWMGEDDKRCASEHRQLAKWLKELKAVHDEIDDADDEDEIFVGYLRKKMEGNG